MNINFFDRFDFFAGVPDSQLRVLCDYLAVRFPAGGAGHLIASNEGNAVALGAGYYLATEQVPVVYLQNSGIGNITNPVASLLHPEVYAIPCLFVVGWRGEPGVPDEPQHRFQGIVTLEQLQTLEIETFVVEPQTTPQAIEEVYHHFLELFQKGKSAAFVIKKGALQGADKVQYKNAYRLNREEVLRQVTREAEADLLIGTTGKISRELFEVRAQQAASHDRDFLCVGSMGHASSIALSLALQKSRKRVWCIDGDGAVLMHMGAMAMIGQCCPNNLVHVVMNNAAHETVGGMPTLAGGIDLCAIAKACGYPIVVRVTNQEELVRALTFPRESRKLCLIEVAVALGSREDLGRPSLTPEQSKRAFIKSL